MKKILLLLLPIIGIATAGAQDKIETDVHGDLVSQYIWRGQELGGGSLQPTLGIGYKGFSLSAWGNVGVVDATDTKELDVTVGYKIGGLSIGVTDYWFNTPERRYFLYDAHRTSHVFEGNVGYDFGFASLQWNSNFAGNDGHNKDGKRAYSTYVEANVPFCLSGMDWVATAGAVPFATDLYGTSGFAVTNLSLRVEKAVKVTDGFCIPFFGQLTANPCSQKAYLVFGIRIGMNEE